MSSWQSYIKEYQNYLRLERGLSKNTIENYTFDVEKLVLFLVHKQIVVSPIVISEVEVQQFIYEMASQINARSQSRLISGLKSFFNYLIFEDYRKDTPLELIEIPKTGRKLPDTLSTDEIDSLIKAIDLSTNEGERNKVMLETLYSCGLRVSELVGLKISDLFLEEGFIKITGKGNKQRFVPIGSGTSKLIVQYINAVRTHVPINACHGFYHY